MDRKTVIFGIDKNNILPCAYSIYSLLKHTQTPINIRILAINLVSEDLLPVRDICHSFDHVHYQARIVSLDKLSHAKRKIEHISTAAYLRLLIPKYFDERVLYLDTDILVRHDITEIFNYDLGPNAIGAVRDGYSAAIWHIVTNPNNPDEQLKKLLWERELAERETILGHADHSRYFNSGVLLLDVPMMRLDSDLVESFGDIKAASQGSFKMDNDWLNHIARGKVSYLPAKWNAARGYIDTNHKHLPKTVRDYYKTAREDPAIVHFTGANKPWDEEHSRDYLTLNPFLGEYIDMKAECDAILNG